MELLLSKVLCDDDPLGKAEGAVGDTADVRVDVETGGAFCCLDIFLSMSLTLARVLALATRFSNMPERARWWGLISLGAL
jgi:hypothetical protein